jgi:antitoxin (DNA-binding transcriptional repressor) of toxin-antitoxin stability system
MGDTPRMTNVTSRQPRNNTRAILDRVVAGEVVAITVDGRVVATLRPADRKPRFMDRAVFWSPDLTRQT